MEMEAQGALPVRLYIMVRRASNEEMDARLADYYMPSEGDDYLTVRSIKRQIDGALGSHGAWLLEPYEDMATSTGLVLETVEDITGTAHVAIKHGFQVNTHAIGDRANREVLDIYESVFDSAGGTGGLRWRIRARPAVQIPTTSRASRTSECSRRCRGCHPFRRAWGTLPPWATPAQRSRTYLWRNFLRKCVSSQQRHRPSPSRTSNPLVSFIASGHPH